MPKRYAKTKRAAAISIAAAGIGLGATTEAVVVVGGDNGWEVSFDGNINAFYTITDSDQGYTALGYNSPGTTATAVGTFAEPPDIDQSRAQSGLLPAYFSFNVKGPTVGGLTATGRIAFAPQVENANVKNQIHANGGLNAGSQGFQGSNIDTREVVVDIDGDFGTFSFGRTLSVFGRQSMLKDQTLYGVGAPGGSTGGAGRIGRGYTYPNFDTRFSHKTPNLNGLQVEIGIYDPSREQSSPGLNLLDQTDTPRFEAEASYTSAFNNGSFQLWVDGLWQDIESSRTGATSDVTVSGFGGEDPVQSAFDVPMGLAGAGYTPVSVPVLI